MTETHDPAQRAAPEAAGNASRLFGTVIGKIRGFGAWRLVLLMLGAAAAVLMLLAELSTLWSVDVVTASCGDLADPSLADQCVTRGYEAHSFALFALAALVVVMTLGAMRGGSRPAALALLAAGVAVLAIALIGDAPKVSETGRIGENFDRAEAHPGPGFWMEIAGGALAVMAGALGVAATRARRARNGRRRAQDVDGLSEAR